MGYKEFRTSEKFLKQMEKFHLPVQKGLAITGANAYLNPEKRARISLALIGEMDALILWNLLAGGAGGITAVANIYPEVMVSIYQYFLKGDLEAAKRAQDSIRPIRNCFKFGNPNTVTKAAARISGNPVGPCRRPFCGLSDAAIAKIRETVEADQARGMK